jgi:REP element-mobilizing transposase RayT
MKSPKAKLGSTGILPVHTRRNLPHLEKGGSLYFVTFRTRETELPQEARNLVLEACRYFDGQRYRLWAATVMPDHVHLLITPQKKGDHEWYSLSAILHSLKSFTAKKINLLLNRKGPLWVEESFDRIMRSEPEFLEGWHYIRNNPVKRELCASPEEWPWFYESPERDFL